MNDRCRACRKDFEQGDFGVMIGVVMRDETAHLEWVHRNCLLVDVMGEEAASRIIARERSNDE